MNHQPVENMDHSASHQVLGNTDYAAVTKNQRQTWASGDFAVIALSIVPVAERLVESANPRAGQRVLDVACGSGNAALVAARRYCDVIGVDYVPSLLERARVRAAAEGLSLQFDEGDAQALPYENESFDHVLSTFGVMFAPDQPRAARELLRVCRRGGGKISLANWTPEGAVGQMFRAVASYAPTNSPRLAPPSRWGTEDGIRELLAAPSASFAFTRRTVTQHYRSVAHAVDSFRTNFGPIVRTLSTLDSARQTALIDDLTALFALHNRATDGSLAAPLEYLETIVTLG